MPHPQDHDRPRHSRPLVNALPPVARVALLAFVALVAGGCGEVASPSPRPAVQPTIGPVETSAVLPAGPLSEIGPVGRATYDSPIGFVPWFSFDVRADGWRSIIPPDEYGFALATPSAARIEALIGVVKPVAATADAFAAELGTSGLLDGTETVEDFSVDGIPARSFSIVRDEAVDAFLVMSASGEIATSFGGPLPENRFIFVAHPDGAFVVLLSLVPDADAEARFVFEALVESIDIR